MLSSWILDLVVKDATLTDEANPKKTPMWLVVLADGMQQPFSTEKVNYSKEPQWNCPARLVLRFPDISCTYLYITLCTFDNNSIVPLARSRVALRNLPIGSPKTFKFPLLTQGSDSESVILRCVATLSSFTPQFYISPAPQRQMQGMGVPQMGAPPMGGPPMGATPQYMGGGGYNQPYF